MRWMGDARGNDPDAVDVDVGWRLTTLEKNRVSLQDVCIEQMPKCRSHERHHCSFLHFHIRIDDVQECLQVTSILYEGEHTFLTSCMHEMKTCTSIHEYLAAPPSEYLDRGVIPNIRFHENNDSHSSHSHSQHQNQFVTITRISWSLWP
jgi:hypothetical protein